MIVKIEPPVSNSLTRNIPMSHQRECIIDDEDWPMLKQYHWRAVWSARKIYAVARDIANGVTRYIRMHRLIMNCPQGQVVHHKNRNTLDNRKCNLEILSPEEHRMR